MKKELPENLKDQVENMALVIDNIFRRAPHTDKLKVAMVKLNELPEPTKGFCMAVCENLSSKYSLFKGCVCHKNYIENGGIMALFNDLKAVCAKCNFNYEWATEFIYKHGKPNQKGETWVLNSGATIENPIAIFTNWCKKYKSCEGAYYAP